MPRTAAKLGTEAASPARGGVLRRLTASALALALALPVPAAATLLGPATAALAAGYDEGYAKYQKGDFKGAERALKEGATAKLSKADMAKLLKLLGICQFMENNRAGATKSFKSALARDPGLVIGAEEVLDDSVIGFFTGIKARAQAPKAKTTAADPAPAPPPPAAAAAKHTSDSKGKPLKQTFLKVVANIATANVAIDGIIAGPVNTLINTDPGRVLVEVSATGFPTKKLYVNVTKDHENTVNVTLEKPKPKPKPTPKPAPKPQPAAPDDGDTGGVALADDSVDDGGAAGAGAAAGAGTAAAGAADAGGQAAGKGANAKARPQKQAKAKPKRKKANGGRGNDDMFAGDAAGGRRNGQGQGQGGGQQGPDLASQFDMDSGAAGYAPPPAYNAPPQAYPPQGYPPQGYAPPAYAYQPPPAYYAPPQAYYPPPQPQAIPPPPPPGDPAGGFPDQPEDPAAAGQPRSMADPAAADPGGSSSKSGNSTLIAILPLGAGQFQNHSYFLGAVFLVGELGALYYYQSTNAAADKAAADTNAYTSANSANCSPQPGADPTAAPTPAQQECAQFVTARQAFVTSTRAQAMYGIYGFAGLWIAGAAEAIIDEPSGAQVGAKKKKKKKKKRKYGGFSYNAEQREYSLVELPDDERWVDFMAFDWQAGLKPAYIPMVQRYEPAVALDLTWTF